MRHKWTPIASAVLIRFRREMRLFQKFHLESRILWWDETRAVIQQEFILQGGKHHGQVAARGLFKGGLYDRQSRQFVPIARLMQETGALGGKPADERSGESLSGGGRGHACCSATKPSDRELISAPDFPAYFLPMFCAPEVARCRPASSTITRLIAFSLPRSWLCSWPFGSFQLRG